MLRTLLVSLFFFVTVAEAAETIRVMNFNTMCNLCDIKRESGPFRKRLKNVADTIERHNPDLISLQEVSNRRQIRRISKDLDKRYYTIFNDAIPVGYSDPVLLVRKCRFKVLKTGGGWLGPRYPKFSFGWQFAIPRRFQWAKIRDLRTGTEFIYAGTHFDNHGANKEPSSVFANEFFGNQSVPVLFAGDTNLKISHDAYGNLAGVTTGTRMRNSFDETTNIQFFTNRAGQVNPNDGCNRDKGATFPECRIDHVLMTEDAPWRVTSWGSDIYRYYREKFVSDHRAVIVDLAYTH